MPPPYSRYVFICTNRRPDGVPRGCCATKGSDLIRDKFKEEVRKQCVSGGVRASASGCLDACENGVAVVVYPDNVWYGGVKLEDVEEIVREHVVGGRPLERLLLKLPPKTGGQ